VLIASGLASALPVGLLVGWLGRYARIQSWLSPEPRFLAAAAIVVGMVVVLDSQSQLPLVRPWSVQSQVPRLWGHEHGPWQAAARYGLRLGVGPATILSSWCWWGALIIGGMQSVQLACTLVAVFVLARSVMIAGVGFNITDGVAMAQRMATVRVAQQPTERIIRMILVSATVAAVAVTTVQWAR
jgi:hypothetical protein